MAMIMDTLEPISLVVHHFNRNDEDAVDRLNHKYSTFLFLFLGVVVTTNQYVGDVIKCWTPAQFPESWVEYASSVCWISNTYYLPMSEHDIVSAPRKIVVYYQWVPLVLFIQAFLFYLPSLGWRAVNRSLGIDINKMVSAVSNIDHINPMIRDKTVRYLVKHIDRSLSSAREIRTGSFVALKHKLAKHGCVCGKRYGNMLLVLYLFTKVVYVADVVLQLYMMNHFLGTDYVAYGFEVLRDLTYEGSFKESTKFPRITLCDFEIRNLGRNQPHTVQCTLPINIFNEKIFIFIWFWLAFIALANFFSLLIWLSTVFQKSRRNYIGRFLKSLDRYDKAKDRRNLRSFCDRYLRQDGHFVLRMIGKNTNEVVLGELIAELWDHYQRYYALDVKRLNV